MSRTRNPQDALRLRNAELVARLADADGPEPDALVEELVLNNLEVARSIARRYVGRSESAH